jgi:CRISPR-associated protein Cmr6
MAENKALQRPNKPAKPQKKVIEKKPKKVISSGGNGGGGNRNRGGGGGNHHGNGGGNNNPQPSPWLDPDHQPPTSHNASFIEYLRWMRPPEHPQKDGTKVEILNKAQDNPDYRQRLQQLNDRTRAIAQEHFTAKTTWRIRVGGHRGPESILLPAFDHLGVPYLPSSTLRGVARTQAIHEIMAKENINWKNAEEKIAPYFGSINTNNNPDKAGKVVFLNAYPVACKNAGITMDMTNNIWNWDNNQLAYSPNPNSFFSLKDVEFLVGLRLASNCQDQQVLKQVKQWLIEGLNAGVGSQINSGYGQLTTEKNKKSKNEFLSVSFGLEGQLIHGCQHFTEWRLDRRNQWQMRGNPQAEVRPVAFKSMLRYWFRVLALGVLSPQQVQEWEAAIFGGISPQKRGFLQVRVENGKNEQPTPKNKDGKKGKQSGILILSFSSEVVESQKETLQTLIKNLTWMMFQLGGIGQGARRPCYSRQTRDRAPWFRGSTFLAGEEDFWDIPEDIKEFHRLFHQKLKGFYSALSQLTGNSINHKNLNQVGEVNRGNWQEAVDENCRIVVCSGKSNSNKPFALSVLHDRAFYHNGDYDGFLCGKVRGGVKPSPVWIADLDDFQVVTVFGATADPRRNYLKELRDRATSSLPIFPLK